jgi:glucose-1-phosphate thymidylyltransferase
MVEFNSDGKVAGIGAKLQRPKPRRAVTGLDFYHEQMADIEARVKTPVCGRLEIIDLNME